MMTEGVHPRLGAGGPTMFWDRWLRRPAASGDRTGGDSPEEPDGTRSTMADRQVADAERRLRDVRRLVGLPMEPPAWQLMVPSPDVKAGAVVVRTVEVDDEPSRVDADPGPVA